jgi:hypothetical protein
VETSYQATRRQERKWFKSARSAQRFVNLHRAVNNTFNVQRHHGDQTPGMKPRMTFGPEVSRRRAKDDAMGGRANGIGELTPA